IELHVHRTHATMPLGFLRHAMRGRYMATFTNPAAVGMDPEKLERVKQLFHAQIEQGLHPGAGLAVYRYGHLVLDIHGGVSDVRDGVGCQAMPDLAFPIIWNPRWTSQAGGWRTAAMAAEDGDD